MNSPFLKYREFTITNQPVGPTEPIIKTVEAMEQNDLLKLKKQITDAKSEVSELIGRHKHLMKELKETWGCDTLKQARAKLETWDEELAELTEKIETGVKELEEKYEITDDY